MPIEKIYCIWAKTSRHVSGTDEAAVERKVRGQLHEVQNFKSISADGQVSTLMITKAS